MKPLPLALSLLTCLPALAQSNAVPGIDIQVYDVTDIAPYGRRGAAYPGGEAGFVCGHSYCNTGTVAVPWVSSVNGVMVDTYPKIAFLLARESGGRMVQVSGRSFLKHSITPYNFSSGPCAPCQGGGGQFMFVGCSDTYSSGINSNRLNLGPSEEIDPWLGAWDPRGSYFDRGDPSVGGALAMDSVRSLTSSMTSAFDPVKNRMTVAESELAVGGQFHTQVQVVIQGEPVANRGNNVMSRPVGITWSGSAWSALANGTAVRGSVLTQWTGATHDVGGNGNDDGRFLIAVKVTGPSNGMWHYEYAVHNLDNSRGGAALRIPLDAAAQIGNVGFRDLDGNAGNDWTWSRTNTELSFLAGVGNAVEWNTLYNFWFDCSVAPSLGQALVDQARPGPGSLQVAVASEVPSGIPSARITTIGSPCGECASSFYELFATAAGFDLANKSITMTYANGAYTVSNGTGSFITPTTSNLGLSDDSEQTVALPFALPYPTGTTNQLRICSNGYVSPAGSNGTGYTPSVSAFLSAQPRWAACWHDLNPGSGGTVTFDANAQRALVTWTNVPNFGGAGGSNTFQLQFLASGTVHLIWQSMTPAGNGYLVGWTPGVGATDPGNRDLSMLTAPFTLCPGSFTGLDLSASARPILGTTVSLTTNAIPGGTSLGATLLAFAQAVPPQELSSIGMTGCVSHLAGSVIALPFPTPIGGSVQLVMSIPNDPALTGTGAVMQSFTFSPPLTPLGVIASNGLVLTLGPR